MRYRLEVNENLDGHRVVRFEGLAYYPTWDEARGNIGGDPDDSGVAVGCISLDGQKYWTVRYGHNLNDSCTNYCDTVAELFESRHAYGVPDYWEDGWTIPVDLYESNVGESPYALAKS